MRILGDIAEPFSSLGSKPSIILHSGCAEPPGLARLLADHARNLKGACIYSLMPMGASPYADAGVASNFEINTFFPGTGLRKALNEGRAKGLRYSLSQIPGLFNRGELNADVLLLQVSEPTSDGFVSLGISIDYMHAVLARNPLVIAEINQYMPTTSGASFVPVSAVDWYIEATLPPQAISRQKPDIIDMQIANNVAELISDEAVIQIGFGSLPDLVLARLGHLKHLGLHSGILTDAAQPLIESGVIDNSRKKCFRGISVTTMAAGSQSFYDFLNQNCDIEFHPCSLTHQAEFLSGIEGLVAINSAIEVDLNGFANAEWVNERRVAMPGGLPDFAAGATAAKNGMSIIAMRSTPKNRVSSIVAHLGTEAPTLSPAHISYVVTEYGIAPISGVPVQQRVKGLISIAHPDFREELYRRYRSTRVVRN